MSDKSLFREPNELLRTAREHAGNAHRAWRAYDDRVAGTEALKSLSCYEALDGLLTMKEVDFPDDWRRGA